MSPPEPAGTLFSGPGERIILSEAKEILAKGDFALIGEGHTNGCDHAVQEKLVDVLTTNSTEYALGLEMIPFSLQPVLDRFNAGEIELNDLPEAVHWEETWGHPFELYAPIFALARSRNIPLVGLNIPPELARRIGDVGIGGLTAEERMLLPEKIVPPVFAQRETLRAFHEMHQQMLDRKEDDTGFERFMEVQSAWDTGMASQALSWREKHGGKMVILAGSGHVEQSWGIPHRLRTLAPGVRVRTAVPWRGTGEIDPDEGDVFFFCPVEHRSALGWELGIEAQGVVVRAVQENSPVQQAGIQKGDRLVRIGSQRIETLTDVHAAFLRERPDTDGLAVTVERDGKTVKTRLIR